MERKLSHGAQGEIYLSYIENSDNITIPVVLKRFKKNDDYLREKTILLLTKYIDGCVKLIDYNDDKLELTMEYISGKSLKFFKDNDIVVKLEILRNLLNIVENLCDNEIYHNDIKLDNIIYDTLYKRVVLIDFGLACSDNGTETTKCRPGFGTPVYAPLEMYEGGIIDYRKVQIYILGVLFFKFLSGKFPFSGADRDELKEAKRYDDIDNIDSVEEFNGIIRDMLDNNPVRRPEFAEIREAIDKEILSIEDRE